MLLHIHPETPQPRLIRQVAETLQQGGVIIYPTDTVYAIGCDINNKKAVETVCQIKGIKPEKSRFSCICEDLKVVGTYTIHVDTPLYKVMKRVLPGPYTFILNASKSIPRHFQSRRKTVGVRISGHAIPQAITAALGRPLMTTSLKKDDDFFEYETNPELIYEQFRKTVDLVIDGGPGGIVPSTVLDCSEGVEEMVVIREGAGSLELL